MPQHKTHVKLPDEARESSACECSSNFCNNSERVVDWCCDGKDLAMLSTADVNFSSSVRSALHHNTWQPLIDSPHSTTDQLPHSTHWQQNVLPNLESVSVILHSVAARYKTKISTVLHYLSLIISEMVQDRNLVIMQC